MKEIIFENITKVYDKNTVVLDNLNLKIDAGSRVVLLGPSGCGKSTTLRIIAGLSDITSGNLYLNGKISNNIKPQDRNISMVFQNYALYPHMSLRDNICYGLKVKKLSNDEIEKRLKDALKILKLEGLEDRLPKDLSGGQRQRVALARALVKKSNYFLLDEPLSNLDAQLRLHARKELVRIHEKYNMTFVYVTHDQVEAMTVGEKIVLLNKGKIQMAATPEEIYNHPKNIFTAKFIGSPSMNIIKADILEDNLILGLVKIKMNKKIKHILENYNKKSVYVGIRPEHIKLGPCEESFIIRKKYVEDYGNRIGAYFNINNEEYVLISNDKEILEKRELEISFQQDKIQLFHIDSEENLED